MNDTEILEMHTECLMPEAEDVVIKYVSAGILVPLRRKIKQFITVSDINPRSKVFLKSMASIRAEKARHLYYNNNMIHPFSDFRCFWEYFMSFNLSFMLIFIPIHSVYSQEWDLSCVLLLVIDAICLVDIAITFASGYFEHDTRKIILKPKEVARKYLKGYFLIDLVSSLPLDQLLKHISQYENYRFITFTLWFKLLRITTLVTYLNRIRIRREYSVFQFKAVLLTVLFVIALLWGSCGVFIITRINERHSTESFFLKMLESSFRALCNILLVGYGSKPLKDITDLLFVIFCMLLGIIIQLFVYVEVLQLVNNNLSAKNKFQQLIRQTEEYVKYKQLPDNIKKRMLLYFHFRFEKNFYKEREIFNNFSDPLKQEIVLHTCRSLVENVEFFKDLPSSLLMKIVKCMQSEFYLINDTILKAGSEGDTMYFISSGTVAIVGRNGKEICHLSDGQHFGEVALVLENEKRIATVIAVECCELYKMNRSDFLQAIAPYPELNERIKRFAQARLQNTLAHVELDDQTAHMTEAATSTAFPTEVQQSTAARDSMESTYKKLFVRFK